MPVILRVRVQAISPDRLSLTLPAGEQISIPRTDKDGMDRFTIGDELTLTITQSADLLNALLQNDEKKAHTNT